MEASPSASGSPASVSTGVAPPERRAACPTEDCTAGPSQLCELDLRSGPTTARTAPEPANGPGLRYKPARHHDAGPGSERSLWLRFVRPTGDPSPRPDRSLWLCLVAALALAVVTYASLGLNLHRPSSPAQRFDPSTRSERSLWLCFVRPALRPIPADRPGPLALSRRGVGPRCGSLHPPKPEATPARLARRRPRSARLRPPSGRACRRTHAPL